MASDSQAPRSTRAHCRSPCRNCCCSGACFCYDHCHSFRPPQPAAVPHSPGGPLVQPLNHYQLQHLLYHPVLKPSLQQQQLSHIALTSLLQRISTLETGFHNLSSYAFSRPSKNRFLYSVRDTAARVIQIRFRSFLTHRSRTLRHLSRLAHISVAFTSVKSYVSSRTSFDAQAVFQQVMDLLLEIDSLPGDSAIVKDGKRSIRKDLLDFVDSFLMKEHSIPSVDSEIHESSAVEFRSHVEEGGNQWKIIKNLNERVEKIGGFFSDFQANNGDRNLIPGGGVHDTFDSANRGAFRFIYKLLEKRVLIEKRTKKTSGNDSDSSDDYGDAMDDHFKEHEEVNVAVTGGVANSNKIEIVQQQT